MMGTIVGTSNYADRHSKSGLAAYNQGNYAAAEVEMRQAENFDPRSVSAHYYRGMCLLHDGRKSDALAEFRYTYSSGNGRRYQSDTTRQIVQEAQSQIEHLGGEQP